MSIIFPFIARGGDLQNYDSGMTSANASPAKLSLDFRMPEALF
jgi:hypothetical protein